MKISQSIIRQHAGYLGHYYIQQARALSKILGFSYWPRDNAPGDYESLRWEYTKSMQTRQAFPVYSGGNQNIIYPKIEHNLAFRFLHDIIHCHYKFDFSYDGELNASNKMLETMILPHFGESIEALIYIADTIGQVQFYKLYSGFVENQNAFVCHLVSHALIQSMNSQESKQWILGLENFSLG